MLYVAVTLRSAILPLLPVGRSATASERMKNSSYVASGFSRLVKKYVASGFSRTWSISWTIETVRLKADATYEQVRRGRL